MKSQKNIKTNIFSAYSFFCPQSSYDPSNRYLTKPSHDASAMFIIVNFASQEIRLQRRDKLYDNFIGYLLGYVFKHSSELKYLIEVSSCRNMWGVSKSLFYVQSNSLILIEKQWCYLLKNN